MERKKIEKGGGVSFGVTESLHVFVFLVWFIWFFLRGCASIVIMLLLFFINGKMFLLQHDNFFFSFAPCIVRLSFYFLY